MSSEQRGPRMKLAWRRQIVGQVASQDFFRVKDLQGRNQISCPHSQGNTSGSKVAIVASSGGGHKWAQNEPIALA